MTQQASNDERIASLEAEVERLKRLVEDHIAALEHLERRQDFASDLDRALLDRVDRLSADLHAVRREMQRGFEVQGGQIKALQAAVATLQADTAKAFQAVDSNFLAIRDILQTHKDTLDQLVAGQQQVLDLLRGGGGKKTND